MVRHGKIWLQVIQISIYVWKKWLTIMIEENGNTLSAILNDKVRILPIFYFWYDRVKKNKVSPFDLKFIYFQLNDQKHLPMWDSKFSCFLSSKCGKGNGSKVGVFFLHHPIMASLKIDETGAVGVILCMSL